MTVDGFEERAFAQRGEIFATLNDSDHRQQKWGKRGTVT